MSNKKYNDWKYGNVMLKIGIIDSLDDWSNRKELVLGTMDTLFDYFWHINENGIHFMDKMYAEGITDITVEARLERDEVIMQFDTLIEAQIWLKNRLEKVVEAGNKTSKKEIVK